MPKVTFTPFSACLAPYLSNSLWGILAVYSWFKQYCKYVNHLPTSILQDGVISIPHKKFCLYLKILQRLYSVCWWTRKPFFENLCVQWSSFDPNVLKLFNNVDIHIPFYRPLFYLIIWLKWYALNHIFDTL